MKKILITLPFILFSPSFAEDNWSAGNQLGNLLIQKSTSASAPDLILSDDHKALIPKGTWSIAQPNYKIKKPQTVAGVRGKTTVKKSTESTESTEKKKLSRREQRKQSQE